MLSLNDQAGRRLKNGLNSGVKDELEKLYANPLPSTRSGALYNAFAYPTKISPEAVAVFIACHTKPGDTVLDAFAGSGSTGLGAMLCAKPTPEMERIAKQLGATPVWGPRKAVLYEVGVLGAFVSKTICNPPDPEEFEDAALKLVDWAQHRLGHLYQADDPNGNKGQIRHTIWTDIVICPHCRAQKPYLETVVKKNPLRISEIFVCPECKRTAPANELHRATEKVLDPVLKTTILRKKRVPGYVYGSTGGVNWARPAKSSDLRDAKTIDSLAIPACVPVKEIRWGELYRSGYHLGISHVHHFYTRRNLIVLAEIWNRINSFPSAIRDSLRLLFLSYNTAHSTLMTRVVVKNGQKDFVLTGAQSGVLYVSSIPVEKNIILGLNRKIGVLKEAFESVRGSQSKVSVFNSSSTKLSLKDKSIDYVFTDPPFGDYIPYAEINQIAEAWLGKATDRTKEIIVSPSQNKGVLEYEKLMTSVFAELGRVLKPKGKATVAFHSAKASIWNALTNAYTNGGFRVLASSILDKVQSSFKQTVSNVSVKGDPLFLLDREPLSNAKRTQKSVSSETEEIISEILARAARKTAGEKENDTERLYSRYVARCLELQAPITLEAQPFYERMRARKQS